jgi:TRAP-type C4-dicarboxylate transport system substrate-binding protein
MAWAQTATVGDYEDKTKVTIKLATPFKPGHILSDYALEFKEIVELESKGKIIVDIEAGIHTEEEVNTMCSQGVCDMQATGGRPLEVFSPQYFFFNAPFVIKDYDHFLRVWYGPLGDEAKALVNLNGNMRSLDTVSRGYRQTTANKSIFTVNDIIGLKLRLPVVPDWIAIWQTLEAIAVPVPLTGLYQALADGTAEASEGDLAQVSSFKLYEVQTHLNITNHLVGVGWIMINETFFQALPGHYQKLVVDASTAAASWATQKTISGEQSLLAQLQANGMTIVMPSGETLNAIREKARPAVEQLFTTKWPVTTWDEVLAQ